MDSTSTMGITYGTEHFFLLSLELTKDFTAPIPMPIQRINNRRLDIIFNVTVLASETASSKQCFKSTAMFYGGLEFWSQIFIVPNCPTLVQTLAYDYLEITLLKAAWLRVTLPLC